jgi:hypothetical protein
MIRIIQIAAAIMLTAAPAVAENEKFDLACHGTHTIFRRQGQTQTPVDTTLSIDLGDRKICEHPCTAPHHIDTVTPSEVIVKGLKAHVASLDEVRAFAHARNAAGAASHDEQRAVLHIRKADGRLIWTSPLELKHQTDRIVVEAHCTKAPFTGFH